MKKNLSWRLLVLLIGIALFSGVFPQQAHAGIPTIVATLPSQNEYDVTAGSSISVTFSEAIDTTTIGSSTFVVVGDKTGKHSAGSFSFFSGDTVVEFTPTVPFHVVGEKVTVTLTSGIESDSTSDPIVPYMFQYTVEATNGGKDFSFDSVTTINNNPLGLDPRGSHVVSGDLNGDDNLDLVISNLNGGLETWFGDGFGGFNTPQDIVVSTPGLQGRPIALGHMDDNDSLDIVFKHEINDLMVWLNDGSGNFSTQMTVDYTGVPGNVDVGELAVGDFNHDGFDDVISGEYFSSDVMVFINNGGASLDYTEVYSVGGPGTPGFELGDVNGDHFLDISLSYMVFINDGDGTFTPSGPQGGLSGSVRNFIMDAFLPADNFLHRIQTVADLDFLTNDGAGNFSVSTIFNPLLFFPDDIASGDLDADGDPDIVITDASNMYWQVFENNSVASQDFNRLGARPFISEPERFTLGDVNNDGALDMISLSDTSPANFSIWLGEQSPIAQVATEEFSTFLGGSGDDSGGDGTFFIDQFIDGAWQTVARKAFEVEYHTETFDLFPQQGEVHLRIEQRDIPFADVDQVQLETCGQTLVPQYAKYVDDSSDISADISEIDHNVVIAHDRPMEFLWAMPAGCSEIAVLSLTANEYHHVTPFHFPAPQEAPLLYQMNSQFETHVVDGLLTETDGIQAPLATSFRQPASGHPAGNMYIYVSNDDDFVYVSLDVAIDNTNEIGDDWTEVVAKLVSGEEKIFRIDDFSGHDGVCAFGLTSKVSYKHQTCEFQIPREELDSGDFDFDLRYYGTSGGPMFNFNFNRRQAIALDSNSDIYVTGTTYSLDFPLTGGVVDTDADDGNGDVFISKLSNDGTTLLWSTFLGTDSGREYGSAIEVDDDGNVYVGGSTDSFDFPVTEFGTSANWDVFLSVLSADGSSLDYSAVLAGELDDRLGEMQLFGAVNPTVYMTGKTCGYDVANNFPTTPGAFSDTFVSISPNCRGFLSILDPQVSGPGTLTYSTYLAGESSLSSDLMNESPVGMDIDDFGVAHLTGFTVTDGIATGGAFDESTDSFGDAFYMILNPGGAGLADQIYFTYLGADSSVDRAVDVALDSNGDAILTGETNFNFPTIDGDLFSDGNMWVAIITPTSLGMNDLLYSGLIPFDGTENEPVSIVLDADDRVYVAGHSTVLYTTSGAFEMNPVDGDDAMFMILSLDGNGLQDVLYSTIIGGGFSSEFAADITLDDDNYVYLTGSTFSADFPTFPIGVYDDTFNGGSEDVFVMKFSTTFGGGGPTVPNAPTLDDAIPGNEEVTLDFTPGTDGGDPIFDYIIEYRTPSGAGPFTVFTDGVNTNTTVTVTGLMNGEEYDFRVFAQNAIGLSAASNVETATPTEPAGGGRRRTEALTTQGPQLYLGRLQQALQAVFDLLSPATIDQEVSGDGVYGAADQAGVSFQMEEDISTRSFANDPVFLSQLDVQKRDILRLLDLMIELRKLFAWVTPDDYQLVKKFSPLQSFFHDLFLTRFFHKQVSVDYLGREDSDAYEFEYRDPLYTPTKIVADFQKSVLLTFGRICYDESVLRYAEEIDFPGSENWYERYVLVMKPWMDVVLGKNQYVQWTPTQGIDVLESLYLFLFGFCLTDQLSL